MGGASSVWYKNKRKVLILTFDDLYLNSIYLTKECKFRNKSIINEQRSAISERNWICQSRIEISKFKFKSLGKINPNLFLCSICHASENIFGNTITMEHKG